MPCFLGPGVLSLDPVTLSCRVSQHEMKQNPAEHLTLPRHIPLANFVLEPLIQAAPEEKCKIDPLLILKDPMHLLFMAIYYSLYSNILLVPGNKLQEKPGYTALQPKGL